MPTSVYGFPFPGQNDPPNEPQQIQDLAQAVEDLMQSNHQIGGAIEVGGSLTVGGNETVSGNLTVNGTVSFTSATMRPKQTHNETDIIGYASTTPTAGDPVVGLSFTVPPSGSFWVIVTGRIRSRILGNLALLSWELKTGSTIGSGTEVHGATSNRAVIAGATADSLGLPENGASHMFLVTGRTPGESLNVRTMHWSSVNGDGSDYLYRQIAINPVF